MANQTDESDAFRDEVLNVANKFSATIEYYSGLLFYKWAEQYQKETSFSYLMSMREKTRKRTVDWAVDLFCDTVGLHMNRKPEPEPSDAKVTEADTEISLQCNEDIGDLTESESNDEKPPAKKRQKVLRMPRSACHCQLDCSSKVTEALRQQICQEYWQIPKGQRKQASKKFGRVIMHESKKITYILYQQKQQFPVCRIMYLTSFGYHQRNYDAIIMSDPEACAECMEFGTCKEQQMY